MGDAVKKPAGSGMGKRGVKGGPAVPSPIAEQWAYLRFLGFGAWWAWIWLCYNSTEIMRMFPNRRPNAVRAADVPALNRGNRLQHVRGRGDVAAGHQPS